MKINKFDNGDDIYNYLSDYIIKLNYYNFDI